MTRRWTFASGSDLRRAGLALVAGVDLVVVAANVALTAPGPMVHPGAPGWLRVLFHRPAPVAFVALVGLLALVQFGRGRRQGTFGALAVAALAWLTEAHAALVGGPMRSFFTSGAMLLGWMFGLTCAKGTLRDEPATTARRTAIESDLAEAGAAGALAATYVGAGLSKLLHSGPAWVESAGLRIVVLAEHPVNDASILGAYARAVGSSARLASALAFATLVIQLGAAVYPFSTRLRATVGTALLAFHLSVWALLHILYVEAVVLLVLFSYPWPGLIARLRAGAPEGDPEPAAPAQRLGGLALPAALLVVTAALVCLPPVQRYTSQHHREGVGGGADRARQRPYASDLRALLDGLGQGDALGPCKVVAIGLGEDGAASVDVLVGAEPFTLLVARRGRVPHPAPMATDQYELYWTGVGPGRIADRDVRAALEALRARVASVEARVAVPAGM
jgi:hypothetical protein